MRSDATREARLRRWAKRDGLYLRKSRVRNPHLNNRGDYMLLDIQTNIPIIGERYDADLDEIEGWLVSRA